ncbi:MAG TPA: carboxyltransferase domain-containing protein [Nakamurella sp.]
MSAPTLQVADCGDAAIRVTALGGDAERRWRAVHHLADVLTTTGITGVYGVVPTYESVLVEFDAVATDHAAVTEVVAQVAQDLRHADPAPAAARTFRVPVVYGGSYGPDLGFVAEHLGLAAEAVVDRHTAGPLRIRCLGAPAGSPMMDGPAFGRPIPRLRTPRTKAPAGAVAVAGTQAVIAPAASPGGWQIIGRTPLNLLDLDRDPFVSYRPGDAIRFFAIPESRWAEFAGRPLEPDHD